MGIRHHLLNKKQKGITFRNMIIDLIQKAVMQLDNSMPKGIPRTIKHSIGMLKPSIIKLSITLEKKAQQCIRSIVEMNHTT